MITEKISFSWLPQEQTVEEASGLLRAVQETVISPRQVKYKLGIFFCRHISEPLISVARQEEAERRKEKEAGDEEEGEETAVRPILSRDEAEDEEKKAEEDEEEEEEKPTRDDAKTA